MWRGTGLALASIITAVSFKELATVAHVLAFQGGSHPKLRPRYQW